MKVKHILIFCLFCLSITGCNDSDRDKDTTTIATAENSTAENLFNDVWKTVHGMILQDTVLNGQDTTLPVEACVDSIRRTPDLGPYPIQIVFYYGASSVCSDGRLRGGKILAELSGPYLSTGSQLSITFDDYMIDGLELFGNMTITTSNPSGGLPVFIKQVTDGRVLRDELGLDRLDILYTADQNVVWGIGASTPGDPEDDEFRLSGITEGRNTKGVFFTTAITDPLITTWSCPWESAGAYTLQLENLAPRYVDLGGGMCDQSFNIQINNGTFTRNLP